MKSAIALRWMVLLFCLLVVLPAAAAEHQLIELYDGSTISGRVVSMRDGVYTIESSGLGTLEIDASAIRSIRAPDSEGTAAAGQVAGEELANLQKKMVTDQGIMDQIMAL